MNNTSLPQAHQSVAIPIIKRVLLSFACAIVSLLIMLAFTYFYYINHPARGGWFPVWWIIAAVSSGVYINIYLILFLPLFLLVRPKNYLWTIYITPFLLAAVGCIISKYGFSSLIVDPLLENFWLPVTIASAATGLNYSMVQRLIVKRTRQAEQAAT